MYIYMYIHGRTLQNRQLIALAPNPKIVILQAIDKIDTKIILLDNELVATHPVILLSMC